MANMYFSPTADEESGYYVWNELGNWFMDDEYTVPATSLPGPLDDCFYLKANIGDFMGEYIEIPETLTIKSLTIENPTQTSMGASAGEFTINADYLRIYEPNHEDPESEYSSDFVFSGSGSLNCDLEFSGIAADGGSWENTIEVNGNCVFSGFIGYWSFAPSISGNCVFSPRPGPTDKFAFGVNVASSLYSLVSDCYGTIQVWNTNLGDGAIADGVVGSLELREGFHGIFTSFGVTVGQVDLYEDAQLAGPTFCQVLAGPVTFHDESSAGGFAEFYGLYLEDSQPFAFVASDPYYAPEQNPIHILFRDDSKIRPSQLEYTEYDTYDGFVLPAGSTIRFRDNARNELGVKTYEVRERGVNGSSILGVV